MDTNGKVKDITQAGTKAADQAMTMTGDFIAKFREKTGYKPKKSFARKPRTYIVLGFGAAIIAILRTLFPSPKNN